MNYNNKLHRVFLKIKVMKLEIISDAKCKHCKNFKSNGRGKQSECLIKAKLLYKGKETLACDNFSL